MYHSRVIIVIIIIIIIIIIVVVTTLMILEILIVITDDLTLRQKINGEIRVTDPNTDHVSFESLCKPLSD